jgi:microcystin-dependent protein
MDLYLYILYGLGIIGLVGLTILLVQLFKKKSPTDTTPAPSSTPSAMTRRTVRQASSPRTLGLCGDRMVLATGADGQLCSESAMDVQSAIIPTGIILPFVGVEAPPGFLMCHGQEVSATIYTRLQQVLGNTSFPINRSTNTFRVPDLRGKFIRGCVPNQAVTSNDGKDSVTLRHAHTQSMEARDFLSDVSAAGKQWHRTLSFANSGLVNPADMTIETIPSYMCLNYIIKH